MLDPVEEAVEEHVVLLGVCKLVGILNLERLHELAELVLREVLFISRVRHHNVHKTVHEPVLRLLVILGHHGSLEEVNNKVGGLINGNIVICLKMEEQGSENVPVRDTIVEQWVDVRVEKGLSLELRLPRLNIRLFSRLLRLCLIFFLTFHWIVKTFLFGYNFFKL